MSLQLSLARLLSCSFFPSCRGTEISKCTAGKQSALGDAPLGADELHTGADLLALAPSIQEKTEACQGLVAGSTLLSHGL